MTEDGARQAHTATSALMCGCALVAVEGEILVAEAENILDRRIKPHRRQRARRARQLQPRLLQVIQIKMRVAEGVDELAGFVARHLRHHQRQQRVGGDVERHAEEDVGRALVELARQSAFRDIELEQAVARRQRHLVDVGRVPGGDDQPARIRVALDHVDHVADLVDGLAVLRRPGAPLLAVDRAEIAALVGPFVPDAHAVLLQIFDVGVAGQEPQQFVDDRFECSFLVVTSGKPSARSNRI